ncbi:MAG: TylF/MycF/NovP-related O-methyltransferase [Candidatus Binataceae bacterium]
MRANFGGLGMSSDILDSLRRRYLDLIELSLTNAIYGESQIEMTLRAILQRMRHPYLTRQGALRWPARAHTMIGPLRLRHLRELVQRTIEEGIPGDYLEAGVWRGGACIMMRAILAAYEVTDRVVFCADSFAGLPRPNSRKFPYDKPDRLFRFSELAVSENEVRHNFERYGLLDDQVVFLGGFFRDTLPKAPVSRLALLRLDGDMYQSTIETLEALYDKVSAGGFVVIDDYGGLENCRAAVHDFLAARALTPKIAPVDETCVWWQKPANA